MKDWIARLARQPKLRELLAIDSRALAALRIGLGLVLLANLAGRARLLTAFHGDAGAMPRAAVEAAGLYALGGSSAYAGLLFALSAIVAVALIVGYRTWLATVLSWVLVVSLHQRNGLILNAGDHVLVVALFWSMFLPLGARASVDARSRRAEARPAAGSPSVAEVALLAQIACIYVFSALLKSRAVWADSASAVFYALSLDVYATRFGQWMLQFPAALRLGSRATYWMELCGPFVAFVPFRTAWFRTLVALAFMGFHIGLALSLHLILFPYVCIVVWLAYLPGAFWDVVLGRGPLAAARDAWGRLTGWIATTIDRLADRHPAWPLWPVDYRAGAARSVVAALLLAYVLLCNAATVDPRLELPAIVDRMGRELGLQQHWNMFAPFPQRHDGWWVVPARLSDGSEVDLFSGASPVHWEKPELVSAGFGSDRWRKYLMRLWSEAETRPQIVNYAAWLRRNWEAAHGASRRIESMRIHFMLEYTLHDGKPPLEAAVVLYEWSGPGRERLVPYEQAHGWRRTPADAGGGAPADGAVP